MRRCYARRKIMNFYQYTDLSEQQDRSVNPYWTSEKATHGNNEDDYSENSNANSCYRER